MSPHTSKVHSPQTSEKLSSVEIKGEKDTRRKEQETALPIGSCLPSPASQDSQGFLVTAQPSRQTRGPRLTSVSR